MENYKNLLINNLEMLSALKKEISFKDNNVEEKFDFYIENSKQISNHLIEQFHLKSRKKQGKLLSVEEKVSLKAKNFKFIYPNIVHYEDVLKHFKKYDPKAHVCRVINKDVVHYDVCFTKPKNISSLKKFHILEQAPQIRTHSYQNRKKYIERPNEKNAIESFRKFLKEPSDRLANDLQIELRIVLLNIDVQQHSEYILTSIIFEYTKAIGFQTDWKEIKIYSVDTKIENIDSDFVHSAIRCDLILLAIDKLFIIESKYLYDRSSCQGSKALNCIEEKKYIPKVFGFLRKYYKNDFFDKIKEVYGFGIGFNYKNNDINCTIKFKSYDYDKLLKETENIDTVWKKQKKLLRSANK